MMSPVAYDAEIVIPIRQAAGILSGLGGVLAIICVGAPLVSNEGNDIMQPGVLALIAASSVWGLVAVLSQSVHAEWTVSDQEIDEKIMPRFKWLPFGAHRKRRIRTADVQAWRVGRVGRGRQRRSVITLDVRGQPPLKIYSRQLTSDPEFLQITTILEGKLGRPQ